MVERKGRSSLGCPYRFGVKTEGAQTDSFTVLLTKCLSWDPALASDSTESTSLPSGASTWLLREQRGPRGPARSWPRCSEGGSQVAPLLAL